MRKCIRYCDVKLSVIKSGCLQDYKIDCVIPYISKLVYLCGMQNYEAEFMLLLVRYDDMFGIIISIKLKNAHLTAESEQCVGDLGDVLLLPKVDGLEHVDVGHTVSF